MRVSSCGHHGCNLSERIWIITFAGTGRVMMPTVKEFLQFRRVFVFVVFMGSFAMDARNVLDPDVWWHLKTGEWIAQHRGVPHSDPFSYTRAGQRWVTHEWLSELFLYCIVRARCYGGLI